MESLQGAGKIAAETSIANRQIFTLGYSTARNIGIGSYVLRLGQRVIQHVDAPIILTGYQVHCESEHLNTLTPTQNRSPHPQHHLDSRPTLQRNQLFAARPCCLSVKDHFSCAVA